MESENDKIVRLAKEWEVAYFALATNNDASKSAALRDTEYAAMLSLRAFLRVVRENP